MKYFALTNDIDHSKITNLRKIFHEFNKKDIKITMSIFATLKNNKIALCRHCNTNDTHSLEDKEFLNFIKSEVKNGHEIAYHGYSQGNDTNDEFKLGLKIFKDKIEYEPKIYIEHGGHLLSNEPDMVTKQNLSFFGNIIGSPFYVKETIKENFDLITTQEQVVRQNDLIKLNELFEDGEIKKFKRIPLYLLKNISKQYNDDRAFIGYTHFGYTGYKSKNPIKNYFNKKYSLEWWTNKKEIRDNVNYIHNKILELNMKPCTVSQIYKSYMNL